MKNLTLDIIMTRILQNKFQHLALVLATIILVSIWGTPVEAQPSKSSTSEGDPLYAGFATSDITPTDGTVYDPLLAKALFLKQGKTEIAIVVCDLIMIERKKVDEIRKVVSTKTGIPTSNISISATHDHSSGVCDNLSARIAQSIIDAKSAIKPVKISCGTAKQEGLAFCRRFLMTDGLVRMNPGFNKATGNSFENGPSSLNPQIVRPVNPVDTDLPIIFFRNAADERPIGSLSCFALHTCVFGSGYSADFPGFIAAELSKNFGQEFISIFGEGTCGDINHWDVTKAGGSDGNPEISARIGRTLAQTVIREISALDQNKPMLKILSRTIDIPINPVTEMDVAWAKSAIADNFKDFGSVEWNNSGFLAGVRAHKIIELNEMWQTSGVLPCEVQAVRIDDQTAVVTLPGEVFVELGLAIKKKSPFKNTMVIELANDSRPDYIPTLKSYREGGYETVGSTLIPGSGELLVATAIELLKDLKPVVK